MNAILRLEGAAVAALSIAAFGLTGQSWWMFAALALVPDLSMLGYALGPRWGAAIYNVAHSYVGPVVCALAASVTYPVGLAVAAVWAAHIGIDRALGYGLKRSTGFRDTHLGAVELPWDGSARS